LTRAVNEDLNSAACAVLTGINLDPHTFELEGVSSPECLRSGRPRAFAVTGVEALMVFVGIRAGTEPAVACKGLLADAIEWLNEEVRAVPRSGGRLAG
jgi:hypothetical protein